MSSKTIKTILTNAVESKFWMDSIKIDLENNPIPEFIFAAQLLKMVHNFVKVVVKKEISVNYNSAVSTGSTDLNCINLNPDFTNPDSVIGLGLHEASHIKYSPESLLMAMREHSEPSNTYKFILSHIDVPVTSDIYNLIKELNDDYSKKYAYSLNNIVHSLNLYSVSMLNWLEDRRIDNLMVNEYGGYINYYHSLYNRFFFTEMSEQIIKTKIDLKDIISKHVNDMSLRSDLVSIFLSKMFNFVNPLVDNYVKDFDPITKALWDIVDIHNYGQNIKSISDVYTLFYKIFVTIEEMLSKYIQNPAEIPEMLNSSGQPYTKFGQVSTGNDKSDDNESKSDNSSSESDDNDKSDDNELKSDNNNKSDDNELKSDNNNKSDDNDASATDVKVIDSNNIDEIADVSRSVIKEMKKLLDPRANITEITSENTEIIDSIVNGDVKIDRTELKTVGLLIDNIKPHNMSNYANSYFKVFKIAPNKLFLKECESGIIAGKLIAKRMNFRNDVKHVTQNRLKFGKITDRLISELPYNHKVFNVKHTIKYTDSYIHLSLDGSGSMSDSAYKVINLAATLASAFSMLNGIELKISFRGTYNNNKIPLTVIIYDSKKHSLNDMKLIFPHLSFSSTTPEGLCFSSIKTHILNDSKNRKSFFINISDGAPCFGNISDLKLIYFTKNMVSLFENSNISILSYFLTSAKSNNSEFETFKYMYRQQNSFSIIENSLNVIVNTINKKLIEK